MLGLAVPNATQEKVKVSPQPSPNKEESAATPAVDPVYVQVNAGAHESLEKSLGIILGNVTFNGVHLREALQIDNGGAMVPFSKTDAKVCLRAGVYIALGNLFWLAMHYTPTPGVPVNARSINTLQKAEYELPPTVNHFTISVGGPLAFQPRALSCHEVSDAAGMKLQTV